MTNMLIALITNLFCPNCKKIEKASIEGKFEKLPQATHHDYKEFIADDGLICFYDCGGTYTIDEYNIEIMKKI